MPKTEQNPIKALKNAKYSFDNTCDIWYYGKKPADEEDVLIFLIRYAKSQGITEAGKWANDVLTKAKTAPELTTRAFVKIRMIRNRNRRIGMCDETDTPCVGQRLTTYLLFLFVTFCL